MEIATDRELFSRLMEQSERPVYAFLAGKIHDRAVAADVAQEAFFLAYRRFSTYDRSRPFLPWVMTIAYNCLVDYWRKSAHDGGSLEEDQLPAATVADEDDDWRQQEVIEAMTKISADDSALLTMFYAEGCSVGTIAERLGIQEGTAKVRLFRARAALKKQIETLHPEVPHE